MKKVDLSRNVLKDDIVQSISTCLHNIEDLVLWDCQLTAREIEILCNAIKRLHVPVRELCLLGSAVATFDNKLQLGFDEFFDTLKFFLCLNNASNYCFHFQQV